MGPLAPTLEYMIFASILNGDIGIEAVERKTLSQIGQVLHKSIAKLVEDTGAGGSFQLPRDRESVFTLATQFFGLDKARLQEYLAQVSRHESRATPLIHNLLRDRSVLLDISNEIQRQLTTGDLDVSKLQVFLSASRGFNANLTSVAEDLENGPPVPPGGPTLRWLPRLSEVSNGIYGVYILAGVPGVGKSTLADQISWDICLNNKDCSVLKYDFENGRNICLYRFIENFSLEDAKKLGKRYYIRESLRTLTRDLAVIKPPAVLVVDSIQKISTRSAVDRRVDLDDWVHRFEELKKDGYHVILVSEINRASYSGDPKLDCFKETGALEYAADTALFLQEAEAGLLRLWVVKNRHYPTKGMVGFLERSQKRPYWFNEVADTDTGLVL